MQRSREIVIVSNSPIYASAMQHWLQSGSGAFRCEILSASEGALEATLPTDALLLLAPQHWRQMASWLRCLQRRAPSRAWLLLADLRLVGMFLPFLEEQRCTAVDPGWPPEQLTLSMRLLVQQHLLFPPGALVEHVATCANASRNGKPLSFTTKEIQCGCAVALGLTNPQIGEALHIGGNTARNYVHRLMLKMHMTDRGELEACFNRVLASINHF